MALFGAVKNALLNGLTKEEAPKFKPEWAGMFKREVAKKVTTASTSGKVLSTANLLKNAEIIVFTVLTMEESGTGLFAGRPYFVIEEATNEFGLSQTSGGPAETWTGKIATSSEFAVVTELSGGEYKRLKTKYEAAAKGKTEDTETHAIKVPTGQTALYVSGHTLETAGSPVSITEVESFAGPGTYTITSEEIDLLAAA